MQTSFSTSDEEPVSSPNNRPSIWGFLHVGSIGVLGAVSVMMFIQLQAVSLRVASEQSQIDELKQQMQSSTSEIEQQVMKQKDLTIVNIAGTFTLLTLIVTMFHMTSHLRRMNQPIVQRKVMAILWMSPIYGLTSFVSLLLPSGGPYLEILKDFYESYVVYQFLSFLIAVLGRGDREAVVTSLACRTEHLKPPYKCLYCLFHPHPDVSDQAMANAVLLECQVLAMQFVFFRPATAIFSFVFEAMGAGESDDDNKWVYFYSPQFFLMLVENVSVFLAFSGLLKFYHAVRDDLAWCQPFAKFLTIKGVVFMTFWQGLAISIIFHASEDKSNGDDDSTSDSSSSGYSANSIQHVLICMEMLFFSVAHWCVFPAEEWEDGYKDKKMEGPGFGFMDFAQDVNLIIDSGKKSMQSRRDKDNETGALDNSTATSYQSSDDFEKSGHTSDDSGPLL